MCILEAIAIDLISLRIFSSVSSLFDSFKQSLLWVLFEVEMKGHWSSHSGTEGPAQGANQRDQCKPGQKVFPSKCICWAISFVYTWAYPQKGVLSCAIDSCGMLSTSFCSQAACMSHWCCSQTWASSRAWIQKMMGRTLNAHGGL